MLAALGGALALACAPSTAAASGASGADTATPPNPVLGSASASGGAGSSSTNPSATLELCLPAAVQAERSATFTGEMTATSGTGRMSIRIELQERLPGEATFHTVAAPGLGVWRSAAPGVKVYRYIKQVTNLSAPAVYRAAVRFRWLNTKGKLIKAIERRTSQCLQSASPAPTGSASPAAV